MMRLVLVAALLALSLDALAQGQDSEPWERDLQVIAAMLPGLYSNANQAYFDRRTGAEKRHPPLELRIEPSGGRENAFVVSTGVFGEPKQLGSFNFMWEISGDADVGVVRSTSLRLHPLVSFPDPCELTWRRSASEFVAEGRGPCVDGQVDKVILSEKQIWIRVTGEGGGLFKLHRAREFECYADIPGVGGGRTEPFDRYDGLKLHDQGGAVWFTSKEGRRLGISMLLVDWPINNFDNAFARDSLVVYLSEEADGERKELGYAFTVPDADRIGINLKWILVNCFMQSNEDVTPFM